MVIKEWNRIFSALLVLCSFVHIIWFIYSLTGYMNQTILLFLNWNENNQFEKNVILEIILSTHKT